ncbi:MAG: hypothetical protein MZU97_01930 [Bacillus subtilis]|nr:hypothetical protein [Bacillus subtilis]
MAEQIIFRNNRLSVINVWDQFVAIHSPAKFNFDMAFICGPGWQPGEYELKFKVKSNSSEIHELGAVKAVIANDKAVFNAIAPNINLIITEDSGNVSFVIERNDEVIF